MVAEINVARVEDVVVFFIPGTGGKGGAEMACQVQFLETSAIQAQLDEIPRGLVYPVGDILRVVDGVVSRGYDAPTVSGEGKVRATPIGVVLELSDPATGEMARSMPVPWAQFDAGCCGGDMQDESGVSEGMEWGRPYMGDQVDNKPGCGPKSGRVGSGRLLMSQDGYECIQ